MNLPEGGAPRFKNKVKAIKEGLLPQIQIVVEQGTDEIVRKVVRDVSGPQKYIQGSNPKQISPDYEQAKGKIPIPRITGQLASSIQVFRHTPYLIAVFSNHKIAAHAPAVHDGAPGRPARKFIEDNVIESRPAILKNMQQRVLEFIRQYGQA